MEIRAWGITGERWVLSWCAAARRGLTERANGDAWPPRSIQILKPVGTIDAMQFGHQRRCSSLTACFRGDQTPNP